MLFARSVHTCCRYAGQVWYSLRTNVNTPFFQVPTLEFGLSAGALDLVN